MEYFKMEGGWCDWNRTERGKLVTIEEDLCTYTIDDNDDDNDNTNDVDNNDRNEIDIIM